MATTKKSKTFLSVQQKINIRKLLENGAKVSSLVKEYGIGASTIRRIRREGKILEEFASRGSQMLSRKNRRKPTFEELERHLYAWFLERKALGITPTDMVLQEKAIEICNVHGGPSTFAASRGWVLNFKTRYNIRWNQMYDEKGSADEKESADEEDAADVVTNCNDKIKEEEVNCKTVYNMDETEFLWVPVPSETPLVHAKEEKVDDRNLRDNINEEEEEKEEAMEQDRLAVEDQEQKQQQQEQQQETELNEIERHKACLEEEKQKDMDLIVAMIRKWADNEEHALLQAEAIRATLKKIEIPKAYFNTKP